MPDGQVVPRGAAGGFYDSTGAWRTGWRDLTGWHEGVYDGQRWVHATWDGFKWQAGHRIPIEAGIRSRELSVRCVRMVGSGPLPGAQSALQAHAISQPSEPSGEFLESKV